MHKKISFVADESQARAKAEDGRGKRSERKS